MPLFSSVAVCWARGVFRLPVKINGAVTVRVTVCAALVARTAPLANVRLAGETVRDEEGVPANATVWGLIGGLLLNVSGRPGAPAVVWANADEPRRRSEGKSTVPAKKRFIRYFAGLELELWK
jgi:hypothetical protein